MQTFSQSCNLSFVKCMWLLQLFLHPPPWALLNWKGPLQAGNESNLGWDLFTRTAPVPRWLGLGNYAACTKTSVRITLCTFPHWLSPSVRTLRQSFCTCQHRKKGSNSFFSLWATDSCWLNLSLSFMPYSPFPPQPQVICPHASPSPNSIECLPSLGGFRQLPGIPRLCAH